MTVIDEGQGGNCINGGKKISYGTDANSNGALDSSEVAGTTYLCELSSSGSGSGSSSSSSSSCSVDGADPNSMIILSCLADPHQGVEPDLRPYG